MYILFDIGGTNTRIASSANITEPTIYPTPHNFEEAIKKLTDTIHKLAGSTPIKAIAGGIAGPLDKRKTMVTTAPHLPDFHNKPLKKRLEEICQAPAYLENDTAMIGLGEAIHGAGAGKNIIAYITISTGVGGCKIVDKTIAPNAMGFEPGHQIITEEKTLEDLVSGSGIKAMYNKPPEEIEDQQIWEQAAHHLAIGLNNIIVLWSPDVIVLGGAIIQNKRISINRIRYHLNSIVKIFPDIPPIEPSALDETAGLIGSLEYIKQKT